MAYSFILIGALVALAVFLAALRIIYRIVRNLIADDSQSAYLDKVDRDLKRKGL